MTKFGQQLRTLGLTRRCASVCSAEPGRLAELQSPAAAVGTSRTLAHDRVSQIKFACKFMETDLQAERGKQTRPCDSPISRMCACTPGGGGVDFLGPSQPPGLLPQSLISVPRLLAVAAPASSRRLSDRFHGPFWHHNHPK